MTHMDMGTTGAKRQTWERENPRELLRRIIEKNPRWSRDRLLSEFKKLVENNSAHLDTIIEYWFSNNYHSLVLRSDLTERKESVRSQIEKLREGLDSVIETRVKIVLLDMEMPNGKKLRECTGKECAMLSSKIGAWLLRISKQIAPTDVVGDVLTEKQVAKLYVA